MGIYSRVNNKRFCGVHHTHSAARFLTRHLTLAAKMPQPTKVEIKAAFKIADKDGNGKLSAKEVKGLMEALGEDVNDENTSEIVKVFMSMADTDGDKMINYDEIIRIMCKEPSKKDMARAMFNAYDLDGNGKLTKKELAEFGKAVMGGRGSDILLVMADQDGDGTLSFKEYCALMNIE